MGKPLARESLVSINLLSHSTESVTRPVLRNQGCWCFEGCHGLRYFSRMCVAFEIYHTFIWFSSEFIDHGRRQNALGTWPLNLGVTFLGKAPVEQSRFREACPRWTGDSDPQLERGRLSGRSESQGCVQSLKSTFCRRSRACSV